MLGEIEAGYVVRSSGVQVGDTILLTKGVAVEATAIIAREKAAELDKLPPETLARCQGFLRDPGISVVREARAAIEAAPVHAMHDPTEGGIATGVWELAIASGVGAVVYADRLPVFDETRQLCGTFGLDPLGVIASGALLIAVAPADAEAVCAAVRGVGVSVAPIGHAVPAEQGLLLRSSQGDRPLPRFDQDEIARLFD
jgi:hydrogenase maturation factor